ncbi:MAG: alpha-galactosidase, partial [Pseudopedobacter sp.]|nr:alpha-galactosidase [Deinococcales bacterium]
MPIHASADSWILETRNTAYALGFNASGMLVHRYWGPRLPYLLDYPPVQDYGEWSSFYGKREINLEEYPVYGGATYREPCLKATFTDGVRDTVLEFKAAQIEGNELKIVLEDVHYPFRVTLHYRILESLDLLERWVTVENFGTDSIRLERIFSAQWHTPPLEDYRLTHLGGRWLEEFQVFQEPLTHGVKVLESRHLSSGHQNYPWFALDNRDAL